MTPWRALVCSRRHQWADRHLLPFPWTLFLHRPLTRVNGAPGWLVLFDYSGGRLSRRRAVARARTGQTALAENAAERRRTGKNM